MAGPLSRRDLFGLFRQSVQTATQGPPLLRPPGAISESRIDDSCARCSACIDICPRQAIKPLPASLAGATGTPYIVAREAPCVLCTGLLCTTVCPSGTLRPVHEAAAVRMGTAVVDSKRCLTWQGRACTTCVSGCPVSGALTTDSLGHPQVHAACTGCGLCEYYCPTTPAAIRVKPAARS